LAWQRGLGRFVDFDFDPDFDFDAQGGGWLLSIGCWSSRGNCLSVFFVFVVIGPILDYDNDNDNDNDNDSDSDSDNDTGK